MAAALHRQHLQPLTQNLQIKIKVRVHVEGAACACAEARGMVCAEWNETWLA
jgi:hypothetical protein